jgi:DNA-binding MarR family transcriptional regulator
MTPSDASSATSRPGSPPDLGANETGDVPARFAFAVGRLNRLLRSSNPALSQGLLMALSTVVRTGPLRPSDLGRVEGVSAPSATRLVVELEQRGLVTRSPDPEDGRAFFVEATTAGLEAVLLARTQRAERASELFEALDDSERAALTAAMAALEKAAGVETV